MIRVVAVGKRHESWVAEGIGRYEARLKKPFDVEWLITAHSAFEADRARQEESERILSRLGADDYVILLDERGKALDSPGLSTLLGEQLHASRTVVVIIGGAYGVDATVHDRAQFIWSLSPLVFPHQLVRLILTEQIYRAEQISVGGSYHHE